ncbi:hypothetical protein M0E87_06140 [Corynebacterium sp. CCM 9185]|uniref:Uncharacterized protein n=1 Tax=Corynebacterium marambiense TaxID=2765364 RepID=A0ABS0VW85_9CORY|nr:hypothetical protein [Corynebacterium marambiense]MBI8999885.1 hypothetical protein [Corynebacterium marambiense]MCK7663243.1 hypothetical protein [Corynebacterium marambiense]
MSRGELAGRVLTLAEELRAFDGRIAIGRTHNRPTSATVIALLARLEASKNFTLWNARRSYGLLRDADACAFIDTEDSLAVHGLPNLPSSPPDPGDYVVFSSGTTVRRRESSAPDADSRSSSPGRPTPSVSVPATAAPA